jgi:hypothetical protein
MGVTMTEPRTTAVVACMKRVFVHRECKSPEGLWVTYAIDEVSSEASVIGQAVQAALHDSWPDVHPGWETLVSALLETTATSSYRRFVARSSYAGVRQADQAIKVRPWIRDGRPGYSGALDEFVRELHQPTDQELGECVLAALRDSDALAKWPTARH